MKSTRNKMLIAFIVIMTMLLSTFVSSAAGSTVKISKHTMPTTLEEGSSFVLKGKISSKKKIVRVEIGVVNRSTNKWTTQKYDKKNLKSKKFNIAKADGSIRFGKLRPGKYMYRIYAHTSDKKVHIVLNQPFTVTKKAAVKPAAAKKTVNVKESVTPEKSKNVSPPKVKTSGLKTPKTYNVGKKFKTKGTISSNKVINRIEVGIVVAATNKWTEYKYDKRINSKKFDLSDAASSLDFDKLPGGTFLYRIYIHTDSGVTTVLNKQFVVKPSNKPLKAVKWAKKIANDNSFAYGKSPETNDIGCYFCRTNHINKPKGYEKTYVCLTFIGAAYAHGAKDPEILDRCRRNKMTIYENDSNFTKVDCWMKIGRCKDLEISDLQPGDVIIQWCDLNAYGHVAMYIGGDKLVEAHTPGWGAGTISINTGAAQRLRQLSSKSKNYVMRYRY